MIRLKWSFNVSNLNSFSAARPSDLLAGDFLARVVAEAHTRRKLAEAKQKQRSAGAGNKGDAAGRKTTKVTFDE